MNKFLLKYFYSWYTIPIIILHELTHYLMSILTGVILTNIDFYKSENYIYNIKLIFEHSQLFKVKLIGYAPLILLSSFVLMFFFPVFIFISIYFLSTVFRINGKYHWIVLPSKTDKVMYRQHIYNQYIIDNVGYDKFKDSNDLNKLAKENNLFVKNEFYLYKKWIKRNKK